MIYIDMFSVMMVNTVNTFLGVCQKAKRKLSPASKCVVFAGRWVSIDVFSDVVGDKEEIEALSARISSHRLGRQKVC